MHRAARTRFLFGLLAVTVVGASCTGGSSAAERPPGAQFPGGSIGALTRNATRISLLTSDQPVHVGRAYFGFDATTEQGQLISGGSPAVWVAQGTSSKANGPFRATWYPFTAYRKTGDHSRRSPITGTYATTIDVPKAGRWTAAVELTNGQQRFVGTVSLNVVSGRVLAQVGTKAISVPTPVATTEAGRRRICTRKPPDPMHYISLDKALKNGKPTVVTFATPALCESRLCGPVVDEQMLVYRDIGAARANFIHVEEFLPGPDLEPPLPTAANFSPAFKAWGFQTEPWTIVIDRHGIIRARFEGPATAAQIEQALKPLL